MVDVEIKFDNSQNPIPPTLVLATKSGKKLGALPAKKIRFKNGFFDYSEINFCVYKSDFNKHFSMGIDLWNNIKDFKLVWIQEWNRLFEIYVDINESDDTIKNINAKSLGEVELSQILLHDIEINTEDDIARDDYKKPTVFFNEIEHENSLLHRITEKAPHYTFPTPSNGVGGVSASLKNIQRTFSFNDKSIYDAFKEIAKEINCLFDIRCYFNDEGKISREINVYDLEAYCNTCKKRVDSYGICVNCGETIPTDKYGYGKDTSIFISTTNLADEINYSTNDDAVKNCFKLVAGDDLMTASIINSNPNGSGYIWYISDELKADMSPDLISALDSYDEKYSEAVSKSNLSLSSVYSAYNNIINKYRSMSELGKVTEIPVIETLKSVISTGYSDIMKKYYDTIDLTHYLNSSLMPYANIKDISAKNEMTKINEYFGDKILGFISDTITNETAKSAFTILANAIIDTAYKIIVKNSNKSNTIWTAEVHFVNHLDESDTCSETLSLELLSNKETYIKQQVDRVLAKNGNGDPINIVNLFNNDSSDFEDSLKLYSLSRLNSFEDACQSALDLMIEHGIGEKASGLYDIYSDYYKKLSKIKNEIKIRESEIKTINKVQGIIENYVSEVQSKLDFEDFLKEHGVLNEFASYRREDTYKNENYISDGLSNAEIFEKAEEFIRVAKMEAIKSGTLQHTVSADLKNLLVMKEFRNITSYFKLGNWIHIKIDDKIPILRLIEYVIDYDNTNNISVEFSDVKFAGNSRINDFESILNKASSLASTYGAIAKQASQGEQASYMLGDWVKKGLDLTQIKIVNDAENQDIQLTKRGLLCKEYLPITDSYDDRQLKIINNGIYLTTDNWKTVKTGFGRFFYLDPQNDMKQTEGYGVIADTLVGNLILSENIGVYNREKSITMNNNGLVITTGSSSSNDKLFKIQKKSGDLTKNLLIVNANGDLEISGDISACTGEFSGSILATSGKIGGWTIEKDMITNGRNLSSTHPVEDGVGLYGGTDFKYTRNDIDGYVRIYALRAGGFLRGNNYNQPDATFLVDSLGRLKAKDADISGKITATSGSFTGTITAQSGKIGGWSIGSNTLFTGSGANNTSYLINANGKFKVSSQGTLEATGATLKYNDNTYFSFSQSTYTNVPWGYGSSDTSSLTNVTVPLAVFKNASCLVERNVVTGVYLNGNNDMQAVDVDDGVGAGFVHCRMIRDKNRNLIIRKIRLGINGDGYGFIQMTNFDESKPLYTYYFKEDGIYLDKGDGNVNKIAPFIQN